MSTGQQHESKTNDLSFESIDDHILDYVNDVIDEFETLDSGEMAVMAKPQTAADRAQSLMTTYAGVRPILLALAAVPLVPETWRAAITVFVASLDGVTASFKAGKDLAVGNGGSTVEMEPKLPTD
jgi:hypothetical protein